MQSGAFSSTRKVRGHGAVSGEGSEPESAPGRVAPVRPSRRSGCAASGRNEPGDPLLSVFDASGKLVASNDNWSSLSTFLLPADIVAATSSVGEFPFSAGSRDAALLLNLEPGSYTAQVSGVGNTTGVALVEVYQID